MVNKQKILIVDDDRAIAELVSDALEDEGLSTVLAHDGKAALALIQQAQDFSLIILDIMMPEMDGLELCRKVRDLVSCPILWILSSALRWGRMIISISPLLLRSLWPASKHICAERTAPMQSPPPLGWR